MIERRHFQRWAYRTPIAYQIATGQQVRETLTVNVGEGGVAFIDSQFLSRYTRVRLNVKPGGHTRTVSAVGQVVWSQQMPHSDRHLIGVEFLEVAKNYVTVIDDVAGKESLFPHVPQPYPLST